MPHFAKGNCVSDELLKHHRDQIDAIDAELLALLNRRANHAHKIGEIKGGGVVYRPEREAQVLRRIKALNQGPLANETVARLFREVMSACLALERPLTIAFLGPEGTFTQAAAIKHFGHAAHLTACASIDEVFRMVEAANVDYAVVPVENSTEGAVGRTLDLLTQTPMSICGEVVVRIHQHLLRVPHVTEPITQVVSHAQSLAQCHEWLNKNLPTVVRIPVASNAEAARLASENPSWAAIAGDAAAERYQLDLQARNIEDEPNNTTRFLVLGKPKAAPSGQDKTSLLMATQNRPGAMFDLIEPLARHGVSMTKLESRPSRTGLWEYVFFVDVEGHQQNDHVLAALNELRHKAAFLKVLGSYPLAVL